MDYRNNNNPYAKRLGIVVQEIGPGYARVTKTVEPEDCNPIGKTHGGVYFSMADTACGSAAASLRLGAGLRRICRACRISVS